MSDERTTPETVESPDEVARRLQRHGSAASEGMTLQQVAAELRGMHEQFLCPKDTYFLRMAEAVETAVELIATDDRDEMINDLCAKVDRLEKHSRNQMCAKCQGKGTILGPSDSGYRDCPACNGKGF